MCHKGKRMTRAKDSQLIIASALKLSVPRFIKPIYEKKYELGNRKFIELCHPLWEDHSSGEKVQNKVLRIFIFIFLLFEICIGLIFVALVVKKLKKRDQFSNFEAQYADNELHFFDLLINFAFTKI